MLDDGVEFLRAAVLETEVLEFGLDVVQAEAIGERCIEIVGFTGNFHLLVGAHAVECTHVVQSVGKFDKDCTDIVVHRVEHLLEVVELFRHFILLLLLFGDHFHQKCHIGAKTLLDIG